ncbi:MAG: hypothetical protein OCD02_20280 [Spirochaetaceae bacterium]
MKINNAIMVLILSVGSFLHAETFTISIFMPEGYKLNVPAPNYVNLGISGTSTKTVGVASSMDDSWLQVDVLNSTAKVILSTLKHESLDHIIIHLDSAETLDSVDLWLVICDVADESLCVFIEEQFKITSEHRDSGELSIYLSSSVSFNY